MLKFVYVTGSGENFDYSETDKFIEDGIAEIKRENELIFISGMRMGAESSGRKFAKENGYRLEGFRSDNEHDGIFAEWFKRKKLVEIADLVIYIGQAETKEEKRLIEYARKLNKPLIKGDLKSISKVLIYDERY